MNNTQSISCDVKVDALEFWSGKDFWLPANKTYTLIIDYPFNQIGRFDVKTGKGMGLIGVLKHVGKAYNKWYQVAETDEGNGYWHGIEDLVIEGISVNHKKKTIKLDVGS